MSRQYIVLHFTLLVIVFSSVPIYALEEDYCVRADITDISPTSVELGDEFTVGIALENCGTTMPERVLFELMDISPYIGVKESTRKEIGSLEYSNSKRLLVYHMKVDENAIPGLYEFDYLLRYGPENSATLSFKKTGNFSVTVIGDKAELSIASTKLDPTIPTEGDTVELTLRIENAGAGSAKSVRAYADHPYTGLKQSFIGTLESNEDGPAVFTFIANKSGETTFPIVVTYTDDFGEHEIRTTMQLEILAKDSNRDVLVMGVAAMLLILFAMYLVVRTIRAKDRIIQQLLSGKHTTIEKKK